MQPGPPGPLFKTFQKFHLLVMPFLAIYLLDSFFLIILKFLMYLISSIVPYFHGSTVFFILRISSELDWKQLLHQPGRVRVFPFLGGDAQQGTGSVPGPLALLCMSMQQEVAPLAGTARPRLSWKAGVRSWWACLAIIC